MSEPVGQATGAPDGGIHEGGCLCGAVRYRTRGAPRRVIVCHCTFCQRVTGSAFLVEAIFEKANVEIAGGPTGTWEHRSDETGRALRPRFCARCGTTFGMTLEWFPEVQAIFGGTFDDPRWLKVDKHIFARSAVPWMAFPPDAEVHQRHFLY